MSNGNLDDYDAIKAYLNGETIDNNGTQHGLPTTPQDQIPHKDGLFGRDYNAEFDQTQVGRQGTEVLNTRQDGGHYDTIEQDPGTGNMYHNRVHNPGL